MQFLIFLVSGAFAGLLSGLIGIGGGLVIVPMLETIYHFKHFPNDMVMHFAAGTSLAAMIVTTSSSLRSHITHGHEIWPIFKTLLPGIILGTITGALIADVLHSDNLRVIFGILVIIVGIRAYFAKTKQAAEKLPPIWVNYVVGYAIGSLSGLLGIGGGMLLSPFLLHCNVSIRLAVTMSAACGLVVALIGTTSYLITGANEPHSIPWTTGYIYWPAFLGIAMTSPIFAIYGSNISNKLNRRTLQKVFAVFMLIVGIKMLLIN